jgi:ABC-type nitrate/sulfonate/bicarbonate transport system substrate-binding protein
MSDRQVLRIIAEVLESSPTMAIEAHTIKVTDETTLEDVLNAADDRSVRIERDGVEYLLYRETLNMSDEWDEERAERVRKMLRETAGMWSDKEDIWAGYDPEAVRKSLEESAGIWADIDTDQMIQDIYRWRKEGSRPPDRPRWRT